MVERVTNDQYTDNKSRQREKVSVRCAPEPIAPVPVRLRPILNRAHRGDCVHDTRGRFSIRLAFMQCPLTGTFDAQDV